MLPGDVVGRPDRLGGPWAFSLPIEGVMAARRQA
jgi:hypothetical protein